MLKRALITSLACCIAWMSAVQTASAAPPYRNTQSIAISEATFPCSGTPLTRTITVSDSVTISDLDFGVNVNHTYRGDLRISLTSPANTTIELVGPNGGLGADNYNVRFDDEALEAVNTGTHADADPVTPEFFSRVSPQAALAAFNGENAAGNWTVSICDNFNGDSGTYIVSELFISTVPDPGDAPLLTCGASGTRYDWDTNPWPAASLSNIYTVGGQEMRATISGSTASLLLDPETNAQTPVTSTYYTGGQGTAQNALFLLANYPSNTSTVTTVIEVGDLTSGATNEGVAELQFSLFDIDFGSGAFQDQLTITATNGTSAVTPTITTNSANSATGNVVRGNAGAGQDSAAGTVTVTFSERVTSVTVVYGSGPLAPTDPNNQGIAIYDVLTCPVVSATLEANKTNRIKNDLYALPGNDVIYTISISNTGTGPTDDDSIVLIDSMPSEVEFFRPMGTDSVIFTETGATGLDFTFANAVAFSAAATRPTSFSGCNYDPAVGYDPAVTFICINPKDAMAAGTSFELEFSARIK